MTKYLYGASVQGIQSFIFQTNKLQEIVGASEIVEQICKNWFFDVLNKTNVESNLILSAAGNIKFFFDKKEECELIVKSFPKYVMQKAPGITISQAVVEVVGDLYSYENIMTLEKNLKTQRSKPSLAIEQGYMILERARRTGGVVCLEGIKDKNDFATFQKLEMQNNASLYKKMTGEHLNENQTKAKLPMNLSDMTKSGSNSWIAVIHADGNGLGQILMKYGDKIIENQEFKAFSQAIQNATEAACKVAFDKVVKVKSDEDKKYLIRPIIIGGDDVTIIIRADLALDFTNEFLKAFEIKSKEEFLTLKTKELHDGLTACAGICYVKDNYPLHYALKISEDLCKDAKKMVKKDKNTWKNENYLPKSSLAIFKVMDSYVEGLDEMKSRTLKAQEGIDYYAGPYWLESGIGTSVDQLNELLNLLDQEVQSKKEDKRESKGVSKIRQLISESFVNHENMEIMKVRMKEINKELYKKLKIDENLKKESKSILYDLINLHGY